MSTTLQQILAQLQAMMGSTGGGGSGGGPSTSPCNIAVTGHCRRVRRTLKFRTTDPVLSGLSVLEQNFESLGSDPWSQYGLAGPPNLPQAVSGTLINKTGLTLTAVDMSIYNYNCVVQGVPSTVAPNSSASWLLKPTLEKVSPISIGVVYYQIEGITEGFFLPMWLTFIPGAFQKPPAFVKVGKYTVSFEWKEYANQYTYTVFQTV